MVKVAVTNDNDILYNSLSNAFLQNELNIELIKVPYEKLEQIIFHNKAKDQLIILDSVTSIAFCTNVLTNAIKKLDARKTNIIILVIDSNSISNIKYEKGFSFIRKNSTNLQLLDTISIVSNSLKKCLGIEKQVDDILWKLGFTNYFKGSKYIKDAILLAYDNSKLLLDMNSLVQKVAEKNSIDNANAVRTNMDRSLGNMLDYIDSKIIYEVFEDYDGRTISLKYFIDLCIRHLKKIKICC
ncbi:sporulation transcriptional activator Spo0A [Clostridium sp. CAG:269]|jgi:hypothetical protein|nr:sporulation transcriptional activator Spo0A [Clostridium sp. CAG:269]